MYYRYLRVALIIIVKELRERRQQCERDRSDAISQNYASDEDQEGNKNKMEIVHTETVLFDFLFHLLEFVKPFR